MKILLVKPYNKSDHIQPSIGLGYLATACRTRHEVKLLDCIKEEITIERFSEVIKNERPDVVGIQCYTFDLSFLKPALRSVKELDRKIVTVTGGPHPSAVPLETMRFAGDDLDFLFVGEAERGLPMLLDALSRGDGDHGSIPGLVWRSKDGMRENERAAVDDLDSLGMPAWDLIHPETYPEAQHGAFFRKFPIAPIMLTRGCPYPCTFCAGGVVSGKRVRKRSVEAVLGEVTLLYREHGIREFHIVDDNFSMDRVYAKNFLRRLKELNLDISLAVPNGVRMETLDDELLVLMKDAGLYLVSLGIESGSPRMLRHMKKGITVGTIRECIARIRRAGIDIAGFFILGFPGETIASSRQTIRFALELDLVRANFFTYLPFPGTESYRELESSGELSGVDWERFYFMNAAYVPKGLTRPILKALQREAFLRFYLRPHIIWHNLLCIKSFNHFLFLFGRFFRWVVAP